MEINVKKISNFYAFKHQKFLKLEFLLKNFVLEMRAPALHWVYIFNLEDEAALKNKLEGNGHRKNSSENMLARKVQIEKLC